MFSATSLATGWVCVNPFHYEISTLSTITKTLSEASDGSNPEAFNFQMSNFKDGRTQGFQHALQSTNAEIGYAENTAVKYIFVQSDDGDSETFVLSLYLIKYVFYLMIQF